MKSNYNFRNTHLLATFFIFCNFNFFGQNLNNITPPSPNAASLGQYADVPVSNYTGIPSISIPLYTIKSGEIELPITLNYHASGIKVAQEASWVGLGWSLDAGGVITRQIRGGDDFKASGYIQTRNLLPPNSENLPPWTSDNSQNILIKEYYDLVRLGEIDAEPDLFYYNFLGYSGKLMFEKQIPSGGTYKATSLEQNNLVFYYDFLNYVWIVTDDKGWVYRFGTRESSEDASVISQQNGTADTSMISVQSPTTASLSTKTWFIDKIDTPNNNRIDFIYGKKRYRTDTQFYQEQIEYKLLDKILDSGVNVACNLPGDKIVYFGSSQTTYDIYLDRITFESGSVVFNTTDRFDMKKNMLCFPPYGSCEYPQKLSSLEIFDLKNSSIKKVNLNYSYFNENRTGTNPENYKRLRLDSVQETFKTENGSYIGKPSHLFSYNNISLPEKTSRSIDYWGYFNNKNSNSSSTSLLPKMEINYNNNNILLSGADRNPDSIFMQASILTKIQYPTGGSANFTYGANEYYDSNSNLNKIGGGIRIESIENKDENNNFISKKTYCYKENCSQVNAISTGTLMTPLINHNYMFEYFICDNPPYQATYKQTYSVRNSSNVTSFSGSAQGSLVGYRKVSIYNVDKNNTSNGISVYNYKNEPDVLHKLPSPGLPALTHLDNGQPVSEEYYNSQNALVMKKEFGYKQEGTSKVNFKGLKLYRHYNQDLNRPVTESMYEVKYYDNYSEWWHLNSLTETLWDTKGSNPITTTKSYRYTNPNHKELTNEFSTNSRRENLETRYLYPHDLPSEPFVNNLIAKNIIGIPLKTENYRNTEKLSENLTEYNKTTDNLLLPKFVYANKGTNPIDKSTDKKITYNQYDNKGNILQYTPENGIPVSIIWGYNQTKPIAKIENATYSQVSSYVTALQTASDNGTLTESSFSGLRTSLLDAMVTVYTYKPLIGVSSITDPKRLTSYYEYDSFNRLKFIKDQDLNILQSYCYNYKGQQINCSDLIISDVISYSNVVKSGQFTRNCTSGTTSSPVTYTVAAGTYSSTVSQADADAKAQNDVTANGQAYANANGICITISPSVPTGLASTSSTPSSLDFSWNAVANASGYKIYKNGVYVSSTTSTTGVLSGLSRATAYSVQVLAYNNDGDGALCPAVTMYTTRGINAATIYNNTGHTISSGSLQIIANGTILASTTFPLLLAGSSFTFDTNYSSPISSNGTFVLKLYSPTEGISGTNYFYMQNGSQSTNGYFSNQADGGWQATVTSSGPQYSLELIYIK